MCVKLSVPNNDKVNRVRVRGGESKTSKWDRMQVRNVSMRRDAKEERCGGGGETKQQGSKVLNKQTV